MSGIKSPAPKKKFSMSSRGQALSPYTFIGFAIFSFFSLASFQDSTPDVYQNLFGRLGHYFSYISYLGFGRAAYIFPILSAIFGFISFKKKNPDFSNFAIAFPVLLLSVSVFCTIFETNITSLKNGGGFIGYKFSDGFEYVFGSTGRFILNLAVFLFGLLLVSKEKPGEVNGDYVLNLWTEFSKKFPVREKLDSYIQNLKATEEPKTAEEKVESVPWFEVNRREAAYVENFSEVDKLADVEIITASKIPVYARETEILRNFTEFKREPISKTEINLDSIPQFKTTSPQIISKIHKQQFEPEITVANIESFISSSPERKTPEIVEEEIEEPIYDALPIIKEEVPIQSLPGIMDDEEVSTSNESQLVEEEDLFGNKLEEKKPIQPLLFSKTSTVPDIIPKKTTEYYITHRVLARKTEKKLDPLFKLEAEHTARKIEEIIKQYGYESRIFGFQKGPIITRFELTPPPGVKLGRITSLVDELKLNLAVKSIRMVAPIPGKSSIGIEVPNKQRDDVFLADILKEQTALSDNKDLTIVIGKDSITGETVLIDLNKLPHLLVAGTTGSGKSVSMNSMISSLIFTKSPQDVRFVMIDPKMVEMALYEDIPHLLFPVITDPRKATKALAWAVAEMEIRYNSVSELKCRDLKSYNEKVRLGFKFSKKKYKHMPYIVIFIDELSDLMMVSGKELEDYITRISQKSRAVGIHLVMATQRPSVDVITGLIKANCPARIAFHVAQKTDSKIILDYMGADALLGKGDFLYKSPTSPDLQRIQAPYISEDEIEEIVKYARNYSDPEYVDISLDEETIAEEPDSDDEEYFDEAWNIVRTERKASASYLQRRMRIGYNKAARLMELMEDRGYVGPQIGSKAREIIR